MKSGIGTGFTKAEAREWKNNIKYKEQEKELKCNWEETVDEIQMREDIEYLVKDLYSIIKSEFETSRGIPEDMIKPVLEIAERYNIKL